MPPAPESPDSQPQGYPLGALFVLVTLGAVLTVAIAPQIRELGRDETDWQVVLGAAAGGGIVGLAIGAILGLLSHRWVLGFFLGGGSGLVLGIVAGLLATTPSRHLPRIAAAMLVGSAIIVVVAYVMRRRE